METNSIKSWETLTFVNGYDDDEDESKEDDDEDNRKDEGEHDGDKSVTIEAAAASEWSQGSLYKSNPEKKPKRKYTKMTLEDLKRIVEYKIQGKAGEYSFKTVQNQFKEIQYRNYLD